MSLVFHQLTLRHGTNAVLTNMSGIVPAGSLCAVVGPNGVGKSTLLAALAGLHPVAGGSITWKNAPIDALTAAARAQQIAYLPQHTPRVFPLRVAQVVAFGRTPQRDAEAPSGRTAIGEALALMELENLAARAIPTLSGGEWQRTCIARTIAQRAPLLVLDEPTTSLDLRHQHRFMQYSRTTANAGTTIVCAIHDLSLALEYADWILALTNDGLHYCGGRQQFDTAAIRTVFGIE